MDLFRELLRPYLETLVGKMYPVEEQGLFVFVKIVCGIYEMDVVELVSSAVVPDLFLELIVVFPEEFASLFVAAEICRLIF